jgi:hypothetical protein
MVSNCAETASNGLDPAIADVVVDVDEIPRCLAIAPSASATTRVSGFPPTGGAYNPYHQPMPATRQSRANRAGRAVSEGINNNNERTTMTKLLSPDWPAIANPTTPTHALLEWYHQSVMLVATDPWNWVQVPLSHHHVFVGKRRRKMTTTRPK